MPTVRRAKTDGIKTKMTTCCFRLTWVDTFARTYIRPPIWEKKKTLALLQTACLRFPRQKATIKDIVCACKACQMMRPGKGQHTGIRYQGERPGQHWEIDFTKVRLGKYGYCYLLVLFNTFSGWVEAYPTKRETATMVAKRLLDEIVPRFGLRQPSAPIMDLLL